MNILAFGITKEIVGASIIDISVDDGIDVVQLKAILELQFPRLNELKSYMIAVNGEYAAEGQIVNERDEVAMIPPVSGG